jgi:N-formylglutamate amidohydrolase
MGALYTHCSDGTPLRRELSVQERADLIDSFYAPHHRKMGDIIKASLKDHGQCLILDCHSFPSSPLPCDADQSPRRPDICIGGDPFHTPTWVIRDLTWAFAERGLSVGINRPYWGTFVPRPWLGEESAVSSMMIELNRSLYMNEETGEKKKVFEDFAALIREIVLDLITKSGREEA